METTVIVLLHMMEVKGRISYGLSIQRGSIAYWGLIDFTCWCFTTIFLHRAGHGWVGSIIERGTLLI